jgi:serine/threonine protein kinase
MHAKGFLHMDVKPGNVIVVHGRPVLFDFGSMRVTKDPRPPRIDGTIPISRPRRFPHDTVGAPADVFSLGVTLYEMLTGRKLPFRGQTRRPAVPGAVPAGTPRRRPQIAGPRGYRPAVLDREPTWRPSIRPCCRRCMI